ncbi:hypothetical protein AB0G00_31235 [Nocardia salmonicida]|uniref:Uncharacterized protein n=1 Tax=Nocardia fluminea TaxID=134984 RepID=A0A2N3VHA6_9NOCA|nr:hypothetical protein [Nocardia fluminea]PKV81001.1 hypothetical protein ATK86_5445 [Nocardia fluminea]
MSAAPTLSRVGFARFVAVFAALVAIAVIEGSPCDAATMSTSSTAMAHPQAFASAPTAPMPTSGVYPADEGNREAAVAGHPVQAIDVKYEGLSPTPVGVVMACLAVFLALLGPLVTVRPDTTVTPLPVFHRRGVLPRRTIAIRKPSLHELCILRT